jgi:hypothetical protein
MKAISLHQPWAIAVAIGLKQLETRGRSTNVRGRIAIHAAQKRSTVQYDLFERWLGECSCEFPSIYAAFEEALTLDFDSVPFGAIIGTVRLVGSVPVDRIIIHPRERLFGDFSEGRFAWKLKEPIRFTRAIPFKGRQGWFEVPDSLLA